MPISSEREVPEGARRCSQSLRFLLYLTGALIDGDTPQVHTATAVAGEEKPLPIWRPERVPVEGPVIGDPDGFATRGRDGGDIANTAFSSESPESNSITVR